MDRRTFLATGLAGVAAAMELSPSASGQQPGAGIPQPAGGAQGAGGAAAKGGFKLKYAPPFDMFKQHAGEDPLDQLKFMADQGFRAFFDNDLMNKPVELQEKIAQQAAKLGLTVGPFCAYVEWGDKPTLVSAEPAERERLVTTMKKAIETGQRVNGKWALVVPGKVDQKADWGYQTANLVENLRAAAAVCEPAGLIIVLEPLNKRNHPGLFLSGIPQTYEICRAVNSPSCKIVDDIYHQQITEGNLIPNIDAAWSEIAAFHLGDNPGRKEPGTGEINFRNIFKHVHEKGYEGVLCMEHGCSRKGKEGERAVIDAYKACDDF